MDIKRIGSQASGKGPADYFTGTVRVDPLFEATRLQRALWAPALRSNQALARRGTRILWAKR